MWDFIGTTRQAFCMRRRLVSLETNKDGLPATTWYNFCPLWSDVIPECLRFEFSCTVCKSSMQLHDWNTGDYAILKISRECTQSTRDYKRDLLGLCLLKYFQHIISNSQAIGVLFKPGANSANEHACLWTCFFLRLVWIEIPGERLRIMPISRISYLNNLSCFSRFVYTFFSQVIIQTCSVLTSYCYSLKYLICCQHTLANLRVI